MPEDEEAVLDLEEGAGDVGAEEETPVVQYVTTIDGVDVACDEFGNPLETEEEEVAPIVAADEPRRETEYVSPYTATPAGDETVTLTRAELQAMMRQEIANDRVASAQQSRAARELGVGEEVLSAVAPYMAQAEAMVPAEFRGTKQGAAFTLFAAMALDSQTNNFDVGKTLAKLQGTTAPAPAAKVVQKLPPSQTPTSPRPTQRSAPRRVPTAYDTASNAVGGDAALELIRNERKVYR